MLEAVPLSDVADLLARAAEARAGGVSWDAAARRVGLSEKELRRLARDHRATYRRAVTAARRDAVEDSFFEAVLSARRLLRSDDDKVAGQAATSLFRMFVSLHRHRTRPAAAPDRRHRRASSRRSRSTSPRSPTPRSTRS